MGVPSRVEAIRIARRHKLKQRGIKRGSRVVQESRRTGIPLSLACSILVQESSGGQNLFGSDAVKNPVKGGKVTKARYEEYLRFRKAGWGMQGVGPMQLTWYEFQDRADREGGCWKPTINMRVGFSILAELISSSGEHDGVRRYNGAGPAAERYASIVLERGDQFERMFEAD